ncbi:hypothetical protein [Sphingobacterium bovistauri]|uniref:Uncharacterized protein n=1 Tax=Sphingobacterium bovistauri TaxID=2781959 RepID=A0ABS7Z4X1_9SPHI|nr:hypothetical protein [Sphingobacterium bovistauri]MCA5005218.1 hypothetical protein [Sphingobacterium bovistauri]
MTRRNFRKIVIEDKVYKWQFNSIIQICPEGLYNNKLEIDFGYYDSWLYVNDKENEPEDYEPKIVTPDFVRLGIETALQMGWNPNAKQGNFQLKYRNQQFNKENKP